MRILLFTFILLCFSYNINGQEKKETTFDKRYYNGYEHDLPEPDWNKLKNIKDGIAATRDIDGNFYFYKYRADKIIKYDKNLNNRDTLSTAIESYYRVAPRIVPLNHGSLLLRKPWHGNMKNMTGVYLDGIMDESVVAKSVLTNSTTALTFDYDKRLLYHGAQVLDTDFKLIGRLNIDDTYQYPGIIYWGKKYKWSARLSKENPDRDMTFYVYRQSDKRDVLGLDNEVMEVTVPYFAISNGALVNVYEYNDKLVVVRFGGSTEYGGYGSIVILDPSGKMGSLCKEYKHSNALWRSSKSDYYMCGGIFWKNKLMIYDENHNMYYFEFPELLIQ